MALVAAAAAAADNLRWEARAAECGLIWLTLPATSRLERAVNGAGVVDVGAAAALVASAVATSGNMRCETRAADSGLLLLKSSNSDWPSMRLDCHASIWRRLLPFDCARLPADGAFFSVFDLILVISVEVLVSAMFNSWDAITRVRRGERAHAEGI